MKKSDFIESYGTISFFNFSQTGWFLGPIAIGAVILGIYVFFIWYRDWFGKNTFSYRLLVLPTARINVYFAKATTILLLVLGLIALQLVLIPIENQVLKWMVPSEFRTDLSVNQITGIFFLAIIFPKSFIEFILYYGAGMATVFTVFTAILFERSYRLKGIFFGIVYLALSFVVFLSPLLVDEFILNQYFYPFELLILQIGTGLLVVAGAIWIGNVLINKKIRV